MEESDLLTSEEILKILPITKSIWIVYLVELSVLLRKLILALENEEPRVAPSSHFLRMMWQR